MVFVDESIQHALGYICVGFAHCDATPDADIAAAIAEVGLVPGFDEYKSGIRMDRDPERQNLRDAVYQLVVQRCRLGVYIASVTERPTLLAGTLAALGQLVDQNGLVVPQDVFVDEGIVGNVPQNDRLRVSLNCDSRKVPGIQLADFVAYHCSYLLKCALTGEQKKVLIDIDPHPVSGQEVDLDWMVRTDLRRNFFVKQRSIEDIKGDDWFFKLAGYGAFFSPHLTERLNAAAEEVFDTMYFGCVW